MSTSYSELLKLANCLGANPTSNDTDAFAENLTRLAGDDVVTDEFENVVVALVRIGGISPSEAIEQLGCHFDEAARV